MYDVSQAGNVNLTAVGFDPYAASRVPIDVVGVCLVQNQYYVLYNIIYTLYMI